MKLLQNDYKLVWKYNAALWGDRVTFRSRAKEQTFGETVSKKDILKRVTKTLCSRLKSILEPAQVKILYQMTVDNSFVF